MKKYDEILKENKAALEPLIKAKYEQLYGGKNIYGIGWALALTNIDGEFGQLVLSKKYLEELFKDTSISFKSTMSHKVDVLIWTTNSWVDKESLEKYEAYKSYISWETFLAPAARIIHDFKYN